MEASPQAPTENKGSNKKFKLSANVKKFFCLGAKCQKVPWVKASEAVKASQGFKKSNVNMNKQYEHTYLSQGLLQPWMKSTKDTKTFDCHEAGKKKCQRPLSKRKHV